MLHAMIMAGGGGTRFWPRSRQQRPKQFLTLGGDRSLLQQAMDRIEALAPPERSWIITSEDYRDETSQQIPELPAEHIVGEPCRRDTAPCIGLGAALIASQDPDGRHARDAGRSRHRADARISPRRAGRRADGRGASASLITFGIPPTYPATGYGYIHRGPQIAKRQGVERLPRCGLPREAGRRPAEQFFVSGEYFWNSGIFVWKAATVLEALREQRPQLYDAVQRIAAAWNSPRRDAVLRREYEAVERISIDYAVMEARQGRAGRAGAVQMGRCRQLAGPGTHEPAGRRTATRYSARTAASTPTTASSSATPAM